MQTVALGAELASCAMVLFGDCGGPDEGATSASVGPLDLNGLRVGLGCWEGERPLIVGQGNVGRHECGQLNHPEAPTLAHDDGASRPYRPGGVLRLGGSSEVGSQRERKKKGPTCVVG